MEEFSVSDFAFRADNAPDQTLDQRVIKRPLGEAQRKEKNDRDRARRQEYRAELQRLKKMEFQFNQIAPLLEGLQTEIVTRTNANRELEVENERLKDNESFLNTKIEELQSALRERAAPDGNYWKRMQVKDHNTNFALFYHYYIYISLINLCGTCILPRKPMALIGGENQRIWNRALRPPHLPLMPDLCISASVQTQVVATESVIDKDIVTNQFTMKVPFLFVASKTEEVSCIRLRGKCSASPEGGLLQYLFEWIPHQSNQESWENLGWSPMEDVGLIQNLGPPQRRRGAPIKFLLWNSVGALNAYRQRVVMDHINRLQPAVLVLTETRLSRAKAEEIIGTFPFDDHRVTPNLGFVGGMWLLWRSGVVDVEVLSFTEQEIHALIKEPQTNQNLYPWRSFRDVNFDSLEETQSFLMPSPIEQVANSEPVAEAQGSTAAVSTTYADKVVVDFTKKLDAMDKNQVDFSDFKGLKEELETSGLEYLPPSLAPIHERIKEVYGDITADSRLSACIVRACYILLCSVIKEMDELKLEQVDEKKMLFWRDAINSGLSIGFRANFAIDHLKNMAHAHYGLKAWMDRGNVEKDLESIEQRMSELKIELCSLEDEGNRNNTQRNLNHSASTKIDSESCLIRVSRFYLTFSLNFLSLVESQAATFRSCLYGIHTNGSHDS